MSALRLDEESVRFQVLKVGISALTLSKAVSVIGQWIAERRRHYVNVCNVEVVLKAYDDPVLAEIVNKSGMATPDGMPLVWLGRRRGLPVERVYGPDLMLALCEEGLKAGWRHYFYGGTPEVLMDLTRRLSERFPGLKIAGYCPPPFRPLTAAEESEVEARINAARPDVVWVGIGTPKQDFWMAQFRPRLEAPVLIAVGAAFNFYAGHVRQAPRWMMRCGLEWLFRFVMEPRRLWRRYLIGNVRFVGLLVWWKMTGPKRPC
jgi:N-acetylglucosaminyldiphosphoundecaprenol N-acetyl-beta-D-mannosaminyltransferase